MQAEKKKLEEKIRELEPARSKSPAVGAFLKPHPSVSALQSQLSEKDEQLKRLTQHSNTQEQELQSVKKELQESRALVADTGAQLDSARRELSRLEEEICALRNQLEKVTHFYRTIYLYVHRA